MYFDCYGSNGYFFAVIANRKLKHATEKTGCFSEYNRADCRKIRRNGGFHHGKVGTRFVNYISTIFIFILMSNISGLFGLRPPTADYGTTLALALITFFMIRFNKAKTPESERNMDRYVFTASAMASTLGADQHYQ